MDRSRKNLHDPMMIEPRLRRDGFSGQHFRVLPHPLLTEVRNHALLAGLCVTDAGYFPHAAGHFVSRKSGAPTALVILCTAGLGWVRVGRIRRDVRPGDLVWLRANVAHSYGADAAHPWSIVWAHATGREIEAWEELLGLADSATPGVAKLPVDRLPELGFEGVYEAMENGFAVRDLVAAAAALRTAFSITVQLSATTAKPRSTEDRVGRSIEAVRTTWRKTHTLADLAAGAGMSVAHYCVLFRQRTGFSPIDFLIRERIRHACQLLDNSKLTVREVGVMSGYDDPYYFTRSFRRVMGCSPRAYRNTQKG